MKSFKIGSKEVGGASTFVIAEAGSNHNRDKSLAKKLIDVAAEAGADAVKFQLFRADKLYVPNAGSADYLKNKANIFDIIKAMEMPFDWLQELSEYTESSGLIFMSSVFDEESADIFSKFSPAFKIASYEVTHIPLIKHVAAMKKPMIISTGLANIAEMHEALETCIKAGNKEVALLHCIAQYPANPKIANLNVIRSMQLAFDVPIGYSDHTLDPVAAPQVAVALGANIIEKTFTLDRKLPGPDHAYSLEPLELKKMVDAIRKTEKMSGTEKNRLLSDSVATKLLGRSVRRVFAGEEQLYNFGRRYLYASKRIGKGEKFSKDNAVVLRSGNMRHGLEPKFFEIILGSTAKREMAAFEPITWDEVLYDSKKS